jgi:DNA-binding IclR family transcriptional regulator
VRRLVSYATPLMRELAERSYQANQLVVFDRGSKTAHMRWPE